MKPKQISSLEELQERKKELDLEVEVSQRELAHTLGTSRVNLNDFLLKKVALPIGGAVAAAWLAPKIFRKRKPDVIHKYHEKEVVRPPEEATDGDPARYHFPVPPPEDRDGTDAPSYVGQPPRYRRPQSASSLNRASSGRAPETDDTAPPKTMAQVEHKKDKLQHKQTKHLINAATLASVAKIAVPAVKMIIKAMSDHKEKHALAHPRAVVSETKVLATAPAEPASGITPPRS